MKARIEVLEGPNKKGEWTFFCIWPIEPQTCIYQGRPITINERGQIFRTKRISAYQKAELIIDKREDVGTIPHTFSTYQEITTEFV